MRSLRVASFVILFAGPVWASPADDKLELQIHWGDPSVLLQPAALAEEPLPAGLKLRSRESVTDVNRVLFFQPRIIERPPYEPGIPINDNVATAIILTGGAALITSVVVEMLR